MVWSLGFTVCHQMRVLVWKQEKRASQQTKIFDANTRVFVKMNDNVIPKFKATTLKILRKKWKKNNICGKKRPKRKKHASSYFFILSQKKIRK